MAQRYVTVLIVGAGPTGLMAANLLGQYGIETLLIERNPGLNDLPRAISIDDEGLRICQAVGLRDEVLEHVLLDIGAQYFSHGRLLLQIMPGSRRNGYPLVSTFNQPGLEAALLAGIQRFPNVEVLFQHTLTDFIHAEEKVLASMRGPDGALQQIACSYLLGCDGGKSLIRHTLGISMRGRTFSQRWLVVDGRCEHRTLHHRYATCFYNADRVAVSIPAPGKQWRWEFLLHPDEDEEAVLRESYARQLLLQIGDARELQIIRQIIYTFHATCASAFAQGRVFLLGDAAHLLPPFGGQGMNCGLRDAHNLTWKLALVLQDQAHSTILATYQQERQPHIIKMLRFTSFLGSLTQPISRLRSFLRDLGLRTLTMLPFIASLIREMKAKPDTVYKKGFALSGIDGSALAGHLLPQPTVLLPGEKSTLLDDLSGTGFALVRLHADPNTAFTELQADFWQDLKPRYICLVPTVEDLQESSQDVVCALDYQQHIARFLHGLRNHFVLIRPDRHIVGSFRAEQEQAFVRALQRFFKKGSPYAR
jgi:3-(3-hydroxy-phenyl)propionate hydroxylase